MTKTVETPLSDAGNALLESLPERYRSLLLELQEEDIGLISKHLPNHNAHREFANMVELGIDLAARRAALAELAQDDDSEVKTYGNKLIPNYSTILGIPESALFYITGSVELLGASTLRKLAEDAVSRGVKLTYSHVRELNRLEKGEHSEFIQDILEKLLDGRILTHRQVREEVDIVLGRENKTVNCPRSDKSAEEKALDRADAREGDALGELSTPGEIGAACSQFVEMLQQLDKKLTKITEKIMAWKDDVSVETLENMCMDALDIASSVSNEYAGRIKDIGVLLDETLRLVTDTLKSEV